jgi:glucose/arabinose dehydrogenase
MFILLFPPGERRDRIPDFDRRRETISCENENTNVYILLKHARSQGETMPTRFDLFHHLIAVFVLIIIIDGCTTSNDGTSGGIPSVRLVEAFPGLRFSQPVDLQHPGDGTDRVCIVSQDGFITLVRNVSSAPAVRRFLDIQGRVLAGGEQGLLGLAFHPQYIANGYFFVNYTRDNPRRTVISRFTVSSTNPDSADAGSEAVFLEIPQPFANHNGGGLLFGADGYLYIGLGDGGSAGDPANNGQDRSSLLGKILRIDVDVPTGGRNYSIPPTNPYFQSTTGFLEEIYAYGFRNPWRISLDPSTDRLWAGDVGQGAWEEIDVVERGGNYGWRIMEGNHCYNPSSNCNTVGLIPPVWEYGHSNENGCSVTGGYVYAGSSAPGLTGTYVYGDYCTGRIWALRFDGQSPPINSIIVEAGFSVSSFGLDSRDELYVCSYTDGRIFRIVQ